MSYELTPDDILLRDQKKRRRRPQVRTSRRKNRVRGRFFSKFTVCFLILILVGGIVITFADIGGSVLLSMAEKFLSENYKLNLTAENLTGNPVKGYTLHNFELSPVDGAKILYAESLYGRINFGALMTGKIKLSEISLKGLSADVEKLIDTARSLSQKLDPPSANQNILTASPAFADEKSDEKLEIPLDTFKLLDSKLISQYGVVDISELTADLNSLNVDVDGRINGLPFGGKIDIAENLTSVNKSELNLGSGKVSATGGLMSDYLDFHASFEKLKIKELTALYPSGLRAKDFDGSVSATADIMGKIENPKISGTIDYNGSKIYGFPVERFSANFNYANYRLGLNNIQANALSIPVQGDIAVSNRPKEKTSVMIKLDGSETNLNGFDKIFKIPELKKLSGKVSSFNANISGYIDSLNGLVSFTAPKIAYDGRALTNIKAQMKLAKSDTATVDGKFNFEGSNGYLQGTVASFLTSPKLNLTAKIAELDVKRVQNMIPDASDYKLSGKITAAVTVKGKLSEPSVSGSINSPEFSAFDQKITKPVVNFDFSDGALTLSKTEGTLNGMPINLSGKISPLPSTNPDLNINATVAVSPAALKSYVPDIDNYKIKGTVNAGIKIQGKVNNPSVNFVASSQNLQAMDMITAKNLELTTAMKGDLTKLENMNVKASAKSITAAGFAMDDLIAEISGSMKNIKLDKVKAEVEGSQITANGNIQISPALKIDVSLNGNKIMLERILREIPALKGNLSGNADFKFNLTGNDKKISGTGSLTSAKIKAFGMNLTDLNLPLKYYGNNFESSNGTAKLYGGNAKNNFTFDISAMKFSDSIEASNIDVNSLIQDVSGGLEGRITGIGKLTMKINGAVKDKTTYSGSGNFSMGSGGISGFKWLDIITKIHNTNGINYTSVNAPLTLQTGKLILKSGSIVKANNKDPIYTYAKLSQNGTIDFSGNDVTLNLMTESNVNYQLINAIQGGSVGGFSALFKGGVSNWKDGLKTFLSGGLKQAEKVASTGDFRIVNLKISGKASSPTFSQLKIGASKLKNSQPQSTDVKETFTEKVINRAVDAVVPENVKKDIKENLKQEIMKQVAPKKNQQKTTPAVQSTETKKTSEKTDSKKTETKKTEPKKTDVKQNLKQEVQKKIEENKDKVKEELKKGLGGLFKR